MEVSSLRIDCLSLFCLPGKVLHNLGCIRIIKDKWWIRQTPLPNILQVFLLFLKLLLLLFAFFRAIPNVEVPRLGIKIRATGAGLHHSHSNSNTGSETHLWPTPQLTAMPGPQPTKWCQGSNPHPYGYQSGSFLLCRNGNSQALLFWAAHNIMLVPACSSMAGEKLYIKSDVNFKKKLSSYCIQWLDKVNPNTILPANCEIPENKTWVY